MTYLQHQQGVTHGISDTAVAALIEELMLPSKPGLVSPGDMGSHHDMDVGLLMQSANSLRPFFFEMVRLGTEAAACVQPLPFEQLRRQGVAAEGRMLALTGGVNTHRGAIFALGLLTAAAGVRAGGSGVSRSLGEIVRLQWGEAIEAARAKVPPHEIGKGAKAASLAGTGDARTEAMTGFPTVYRWGLPALRMALAEGASRNASLMHALFSLLAHTDDTNLIHRGGLAGFAWARAEAQRFLDAGSVFAQGWKSRVALLHQEFVRRRLSPGGTADLLGAVIFIHHVEE